ncbi:hypothetical protein FB567DRAFT_594441 [Paraphoma chrysanthemicola]|uniref:DUF7730 domain-containing protein n=1 Tax=Paraphoma chrysanthemicola TaxID=798071 RepID=A0A8K0VWV2_9PLEO|nr:hypothetical protein FB567DRAFT_594441 [Paraphoma chrysanthemicola]
MAQVIADDVTFGSGRYSKRKRTQVTYHMDELDFSDSESDFEGVQVKKHKGKSVPKRLPKSQVFPFMQLPAEVRNMIYTHALHDEDSINLVATFKHRRRATERVTEDTADKLSGGYRAYSASQINNSLRASQKEVKPLVPSLLAVNKQINSEARDILYANDFIFVDSVALYNFIINVGPVVAKLLQSVRIMTWGYGRALKGYNHSCFAVLAWATDLKSLYLDRTAGYASSPKRCADQLYRDAFVWLEAVGAAKGSVDAAVDIIQLKEEIFESRYWDGTTTRTKDGKEEMNLFRETLRKLLGAQQKRILAKPAKKRKIRGDAVTDEL